MKGFVEELHQYLQSMLTYFFFKSHSKKKSIHLKQYDFFFQLKVKFTFLLNSKMTFYCTKLLTRDVNNFTTNSTSYHHWAEFLQHQEGTNLTTAPALGVTCQQLGKLVPWYDL